LIRLLIAEHLGQETVLEALTELEPNPPWMIELLKLRADTYEAVKHPLAGQAARDLAKFRRQAK
jgi:hypothetical protein